MSNELVEKEFYEEEKNELTMAITPISKEQMLKIFQRTPLEHIYVRPAKGGGQWSFVTGVYVKKILNYVFGFLWDFEIKDKGREGDQVWVLGRLTVKNNLGSVMIVKEQFGRADIKLKKGTNTPLDYGNDLKAASTDALKKCASELGIASDIYGKNEFKDIKGIDNKKEKSQKQKEENIEMVINKTKKYAN